MWKDPIVEEVHKIREELAKESKYDLNNYFEKLRKMEKKEDLNLLTNLTKKNKSSTARISS